MRNLVACPECKHQYDVSRMEIGSRFRCRCGTVVTVANPRGHNARVVRCSSCGAARDRGSAACSHCGSDFTLHERDLHTVCPECLARVSDRAKFCHHCGTPLCPEDDAGEVTSLLCPACVDEPQLHSRRLGNEKLSSLECDHCAGFWIGIEAFERLAKRARKSKVPPVVARTKSQSQPEAARPQQRTGYRPCPACKNLMNRYNYGHNSGVIIDLCREHGMWFDNDELARILGWLGEGGEPQRHATARGSSESSQKSKQRRAASIKPMRRRSVGERRIASSDLEDVFPAAAFGLGALLSTLFDLSID